MKTITFQKNNDKRLRVRFEFEGLILASYTYILWDTISNTRVETHYGNNDNPDDDEYSLPLPTISNDQRLMELDVSFLGLEPDDHPRYNIIAIVSHDGTDIGHHNVDGDITGKKQNDGLFIKLKAV